MSGQNLERHLWKNRILIVKTHQEGAKKYQDQVKEFKSLANEFEERKLVLYQVEGTRYKLLDYGNADSIQSGEVSQKLEKEVLIGKDPFEVILIGLDGNVKLQQTQVMLGEELFKIIDRMPMRKAELRRKKRDG